MAFELFGGIDPGLKGALMVLDSNRQIVAKMPMGTLDQTINFLSALKGNLIVMIEKAQARPGNGTVAMFNYGQGYGEILGVMATLGIPHMMVHPATWTKRMHAGQSKDLEAKARSLKAVGQLFPGLDLRASERCKIQHDGLVDALLLAEYCRLTHLPIQMAQAGQIH